MEITVVKTTVKKTGAKNGKAWAISEVVTDKGIFDSFDSFDVGETVDVEVTKNANPQYNDNIRRSKQKQSNAAAFKQAEVANKAIDHNNAKDLRITKLSAASTAAEFYQQRQATEDQMMKLAQRIYNWATTETDDLNLDDKSDLPF